MLKALVRLLVSALVVDGGGGRNDHGDSCNFDTRIHSVSAGAGALASQTPMAFYLLTAKGLSVGTLL